MVVLNQNRIIAVIDRLLTSLRHSHESLVIDLIVDEFNEFNDVLYNKRNFMISIAAENSSDLVTETSTTNNTFVPESESQNSDGSNIESVVNSLSAIVSPVGSVSVTSPAEENTEMQVDESKLSETLVECPNACVDDMPALSDPSVTVVSAASSDDDQDQQSIYHIKWIKFKGSSLPIITQNENGPCPLLAIMNLLFLQEKIKLASQMELITSSQLISYLADWIFEHVPKVEYLSGNTLVSCLVYIKIFKFFIRNEKQMSNKEHY